MKIIHNTSERLIIEQGDLYLGYLRNLGCSVYLLTLLSLPILPASLQKIFTPEILKCNRIEPTQVNCEINKKLLTKVTGAEVKKIEDDEATIYQVQIYSKGQPINFRDTFTNNEEATQITKQINYFLTNSKQKDFEIVNKGGIMSNLMTISFIAISGISTCFLIYHILLIRLKGTWDFDKVNNKLTATNWLIYNRKIISDYSLFDLNSLEMYLHSPYYWRYNFNLVYSSGSSVNLDFHATLNNAKSISNTLEKFLNVNLNKIILPKSSAKEETWNFFLDERKLTVLRFNRDTIAEYSLLGKVNLEIDDSKKDSDGDTIYQLYLVLDSGEKLDFGSTSSEIGIKDECSLIEELVLNRIKL
jgi:hypothetical protein